MTPSEAAAVVPPQFALPSSGPAGSTAVQPAGTPEAPGRPIPPPKIALVLGGGGARGFAHVGILRILEQEKIPIDLIVGTSVGSLIGALYASEANTFELEWKSFKIEKDDLFDFSLFSAKTGPVKGDAIVEFVKNNIRAKTMAELRIPLVAVAVDLNTGARVELDSGPVADAVRASVSIPGVFTPAQIGGRTLVDGGVLANVAVDTARGRGADIVIASNISQNVVDYQVNDVVGIILQAINIMMSEMTKSQLGKADVVITPNIGDVDTMDFTQKKRCMDEGIAAARRQVDAIKEAIRRYYVSRGGTPPRS